MKSAFESRIVVVSRNILGFSCSHPIISKIALGALSVFSVATLVFLYVFLGVILNVFKRSFACLGHAHPPCQWCHDPLPPSFRVLQKGERFNVLLLDRVLDMDRVGRWKALDPLKSAFLAVYPVSGAILM